MPAPLFALQPVIWEGGIAFVTDDGRYKNLPWEVLIAFFAIILIGALIGFLVDNSERAWRDQRRRDADAAAAAAQAHADARYYRQRTADIRAVKEVLNAQTHRIEQTIQEEYERFEAEDRKEADAHEAMKRSLGSGGGER